MPRRSAWSVVGYQAAFFSAFAIECFFEGLAAFFGAFALLGSAILGTLGLIAGIWAEKFDQLAAFQNFLIMPLTFLGGTFYSISMLPPVWQTVSLFNPVVYLISGFRWSFFENADVSVALSLSMTVGFLCTCLLVVRWIFKTGYKIRN